jgi:ankyrin repeat protein
MERSPSAAPPPQGLPIDGITFCDKILVQCVYSGLRRRQDHLVARLCLSKTVRDIVVTKWHLYEYKNPIVEAARLGLIKCVKLFHKYGHLDPNDIPLPADSPLHHAAKAGHLAVVKYLVEHANCDPSRTIAYTGANPLHSAAKRGQLDVVRYLVESANVDPSAVDGNGHNGFHMASQNGYFDIIVYLHQTGKIDGNQLDHSGISPIEMASRAGYVDIVKYLVEQVGVLNKPSPTHPKPKKPAKQMLCKSVILACGQGHVELLTYLIDVITREGTNLGNFLRYQDKSEALFKAIVNGQFGVLQVLLKTLVIDDRMASSIFRLAAQMGQIEIVRYLLRVVQQKVNLFLPDAQGVTALHLAAMSLDLKTIKFLVEKAKLPTAARTGTGDSILHYALRSRQVVAQRKYEVITYLMQVAPELVESINNNGETVYDLLKSNLVDKSLSDYLRALFDQIKVNIKIAKARGQSPAQTRVTSPQYPAGSVQSLESKPSSSSGVSEREVMLYVQAMYQMNVIQLPDASHPIFEQVVHMISNNAPADPSLPSRKPDEIARILQQLTQNTGRSLLPWYQQLNLPTTHLLQSVQPSGTSSTSTSIPQQSKQEFRAPAVDDAKVSRID